MIAHLPPVPLSSPPAVVSPALSPESVATLARMKGDRDFWCARVFTIRDKRGADRRLVVRPAQRAVGADERRQLAARGYARQYILKARQGGFSTYEQAAALHQVTWARPGFDALTLADTRENTDKLFAITAHAVEQFPEALLPTLSDRAAREVSVPALNTHFYTGTAGSTKTGRGLTLLRAHCSEFAHYDAPRETLKAIRPALVPVGSTIVLETTGSGQNSEGHAFWQEAVAGTNGYVALFYPWWECDPESYRLPLFAPDELGALEPEEQELVRRFGLAPEQLKWRRATMAEMGRADFLQEYAEDPETCWMAVGGMFYDAELLKALMLRAPAPASTDLNGALECYGELAPGERAIIGADTAEGGGGDRSTFSARAFPSWRRLATYASRDVEPKEFAGILNTAGRRFNANGAPALLVVEKNAHGITVLRHLRDDHAYPVGAIYHRSAAHDKDRAGEERTERIGWATTGESLPLMLDAGRELLKAARDGYAEVPAAGVLRDAFAVVRGKDGKVSLNGKDLLVADMLAWLGRTASTDTAMLDHYAAQAAALRAAAAATAGGSHG